MIFDRVSHKCPLTCRHAGRHEGTHPPTRHPPTHPRTHTYQRNAFLGGVLEGFKTLRNTSSGWETGDIRMQNRSVTGCDEDRASNSPLLTLGTFLILFQAESDSQSDDRREDGACQARHPVTVGTVEIAKVCGDHLRSPGPHPPPLANTPCGGLGGGALPSKRHGTVYSGLSLLAAKMPNCSRAIIRDAWSKCKDKRTWRSERQLRAALPYFQWVCKTDLAGLQWLRASFQKAGSEKSRSHSNQARHASFMPPVLPSPSLPDNLRQLL